MKIVDWLHDSMIRLRGAGVDSPRRDCLVLVEDLLNRDRAWVLAHYDHELSSGQLRELRDRIKRRIDREPLAYIRGKAWFYGRFFEVSPDVMVPRPESEAFVDLAKEIRPRRIYDIGTGSGCLAITAKLEMPETEVGAIENDPQALKIARKNAENHKVQIDFVQLNILEDQFHFFHDREKNGTLFLVNLPYVPDGLITTHEINYEPASALFSGEDGLDHYREFWQAVSGLREKPSHILAESLKSQHKPMKEMAQKAGYELTKTKTLVQLFTR